MAQEERKIIKIGGVPMHIVLGKTHQEWKEKYGGRCFCFFSLGDFVNGIADADSSVWYWLIDGKMYETTEETEGIITQEPLADSKFVSSKVGTLTYEFCEETLDVLYNAIVYLGYAPEISLETWKKTCRDIFK